MSLDWDTETCVPPTPQTDEERGNRHALIWACLGLDLGGIKPGSIDEWMFRIYYSQRVGVPMLDVPEDWTPADMRRCLERWVGLRTNVTTTTRKKWLARMAGIVEREVNREVERSREETEAEHA